MARAVRHIEVVGWGKFNGRNDVGHSSWFRMQNSIASDPQFFTLDTDEKWFLICVFCLASAKNNPIIVLPDEALAAYARVPVEKVTSAIQKLTAIDTLRERTARVSDRSRKRAADVPYGRTDGRTDDAAPLLKIWNENRGPLPEAKECREGTKRGRAAASRWREKPDSDHWVSVARRLAASPFCCGENQSGWRATFDFFVQPDTATKALEGKYDPPPPKRGAINTAPLDITKL
jgi:hypothetical protein